MDVPRILNVHIALNKFHDMPARTPHADGRPAFEVVPYSAAQRQGVDWLALMHRQHNVHALLEVDVTQARRAVREFRARTGEPVSFTAYVVACLGRAIDGDRRMHAMRRGRAELVLFDDVDVTVLVETELDDTTIPMPHIVRSANRLTVAEITRAIRDAQAGLAPYPAIRRWLPIWLLVPRFIRRMFWTLILGDPERRKRLTGTAAVTAVGMFGRGTAWAIPITNFPISLSVGGIARRPTVVRRSGGPALREEAIEIRDQLALTISIDHDLIDGAPAARFAMRLKKLIESGAGVWEKPSAPHE